MSETTAITSGTEKNQYGLYPAIEDYLALEYMPSMLHLVEMNLGNTGDNLRIFKDASVWVNTIYQQATNNGVTSDYKGLITDDADSKGAALTAYQTIFGSDNGTWEGTLYYKFKEFVMNSGKLSYSVYTNLKQTLDDMYVMYNNLGGVDTVFTGTATTTDQNSAYYWWYEGQLSVGDIGTRDETIDIGIGTITVPVEVITSSKKIGGTTYNRLSTQENLINSIYSVESISIQEQAILRQVMFLYENYLKSASSLLAGIDQAIQSLAVNVRST